MSNIFDAIQKAESEQPGIPSAPGKDAAELLEEMERRAASRWEAQAGGNSSAEHASGPYESSLLMMEPLAEESAGQEPRPGGTFLNGSLATASAEEVRSRFKVVKGSITEQSRLVLLSELDHPAAEAYRLLALRLRKLQQLRRLRTLLITSAIPQEGKSLTAANMACALAEDGRQRVLLLEGDLRRPTQARIFGIEHCKGLRDLLVDNRDFSDCIHELEQAGLWIMPAGKALRSTTEVLQTNKLADVLAELEKLFDWIVVDAPPVLPLADTSVWMQLVDGILLVTRQGVAQKRQLQQAIKTIPQERLLGAVLNCATSIAQYGYDYYRSSEPEQTNDSEG